MRIRDIPMDLWQTAQFGAYAVRDLGGGVEFRLAPDGKGVQIGNGTRAAIRAGRFYWMGDPKKEGLLIAPVGPLPAGRAATFAFRAPRDDHSEDRFGGDLADAAPYGRTIVRAAADNVYQALVQAADRPPSGSLRNRAGLIAILDGIAVPLDAGEAGKRREELAVLVIAP